MTTATEWAPQYDHNEVEKGWYERWEQASYFRADDTSDKPPFCIVIPPPNVTGALHMISLQNRLQYHGACPPQFLFGVKDGQPV